MSKLHDRKNIDKLSDTKRHRKFGIEIEPLPRSDLIDAGFEYSRVDTALTASAINCFYAIRIHLYVVKSKIFACKVNVIKVPTKKQA